MIKFFFHLKLPHLTPEGQARRGEQERERTEVGWGQGSWGNPAKMAHGTAQSFTVLPTPPAAPHPVACKEGSPQAGLGCSQLPTPEGSQVRGRHQIWGTGQ